MRLTLAILLCLTLRLAAQTNDVYLFCRDISVASNVVAKLDEACGYPSPATKTLTAVSWLVSTNGTNCLLTLSIAPVYAPRVRQYLDVSATLESRLTQAQWGTVERDTNRVATVRTREVARVDAGVVERLGGFGTVERTRETAATNELERTR